MSQHVDRDWKSRDKRGCTDKVKHRSKSSAEQEASRLTVFLGKKMNAYKCVYCRFNTWHVGTHIESDEAPVKQEFYTQPLETFKRVLVKQGKKVEAEIKKGPFHVLAPMVEIERVDKEDEVKWTENKVEAVNPSNPFKVLETMVKPVRKTIIDMNHSYHICKFATEVIRQMDLYTSGKFPKQADGLQSISGYLEHYDIKSKSIGSAMGFLGYFDKCQMLGKTRIVQPAEFHAAFIEFLEDKYPEATKHRDDLEVKRKHQFDKIHEAKVAKKVVEVKANPNDTLMASKLKDVIKAMQELLVIIEGESK